MSIDERRHELLAKANSMIDTISDAMRMVENVEGAKKKFLRIDSELSLELPVQGTDEFKDVFRLAEIFDERGIEKIKAYILTELEFLEEQSLRVLDNAGFHTEAPKEQELVDIPFTPDPEEVLEEDDSDMIIVPEKLEKKGSKAIDQKTIRQIEELASAGKGPSEIAKQVGVSQPTASRYSKKFMETIANKDTKPGRSVSR